VWLTTAALARSRHSHCPRWPGWTGPSSLQPRVTARSRQRQHRKNCHPGQGHRGLHTGMGDNMIGADVLFTDAEYECHGNGTTLRLKPKRLNDTNGISKTGSPPTRATHCYVVILQQNANGRLIHCILNLKHVNHDLSRGKTCPLT